MKNIIIKKTSIIKNKNGNLVKFVSAKDFKKNWKFGELYLSSINKNSIKGWHYHKLQTSCVFVLLGKVKFVVSKKGDNFKSFILTMKNKKIIIISPKTWYAFKGYGKENYIVNLSNKIYSKKNSIKKNINEFKYKWIN